MTALDLIAFVGLLMLGGLVAGYIGALIKNRDPSFWGFVGFFFPPAIVLLLILKRSTGVRGRGLSWDHRDHLDEITHNPPG